MSNTRIWHRVPLTKLVFPGECSICGAETDRFQDVTGDRNIMAHIVERIIGWGRYITVPVPVCNACAAMHRRKRIKSVALATIIGTGATFGALVVLVRAGFADHHLSTAMLGLLFVASPVVGYIAGRSRPPVRLRNYSKRDEAVDVSFTNQRFGDRALGRTP